MSGGGRDLKALQLVAIQHELAMQIGLDLDLDRMLQPFMRTCLRRLGLRAVHFFLAPESQRTGESGAPWHCRDADRRMSVPVVAGESHDARVLESLGVGFDCQAGASQRREQGERHYLFYPLERVGFMVLERSRRPIDNEVARSLEPIFARLAVSCRACLEHHRILEEVSARKEAEAQIVRQAAYDTLTDLPNRKTLNQRLRQAVSAARRHGHYGAVYFIDVDRFKGVNDSLGHAAGDALLVEMARRMRGVARTEDTLARVGGDEFILVATNLGADVERASRAATILAERLSELTSRPLHIQGSTIEVSTSVGLALFPNSLGTTSLERHCDEVIRFADTAMYRAKDRGRGGYQFFALEMQEASTRRLQLESELRRAVADGDFTLLYQPLVDPAGRILAAEALIRWSSPHLGPVSPADFIPVAEETGLIVDIGLWSLREGCEMLARTLSNTDVPPLESLSINISARHIRHPGFVDHVRDAIRLAGIPPARLVLELTETAAVDDIEDTVAKMTELAETGVAFALDDFGTGYSSLSYLNRLPVRTLKIDRSFVTGIRGNRNNQGIVEATLAMAGRLGIECVVEGVETQADVEYFTSAPIRALQGYYFSRPLPERELLGALLRGHLRPQEDPVAAATLP